MKCHQCGLEACTCRFYPADYSLKDWLWLRRGWLNYVGEVERWFSAQQSALGPSRERKIIN